MSTLAPATLVRPIRSEEADAAARIVSEAFAGIHDHHRFARDFPSIDAAAGLVAAFAAHPSIWGIVAERDGRILGSNFLDERGPIRGVGPITVDPGAQERGIGRRLMEAVLDRAADADGVRLLQDAFKTRSMALYASFSVHRYERTAELADAMAQTGAYGVFRGERLTGYATSLAHFASAHAVAESPDAMAALIAGAAAGGPVSSCSRPARTSSSAGALAAGLHVVKPMNYMVIGHHREPAGAWIPSVLY